MSTPRIVFVVVLCAAPWVSPRAEAQFKIVIDPPGGAILYGCTAGFSVQPLDPYVIYSLNGASWTYQETAPQQTELEPIPMNNAGTPTLLMDYLGTYTIQAFVSYSDRSDPRNPKDYTKTLTATVNVVVPDDIVIPTPPDNATTMDFLPRQGAVFSFLLTAKGKAICGADGFVRENITNEVLFGFKQNSQFNVGIDKWLGLNGNRVLDFKGLMYFKFNFDPANIGDTIHSYTQTLILYLPDLAQTYYTIPINHPITVTLKKNANSRQVDPNAGDPISITVQ